MKSHHYYIILSALLALLAVFFLWNIFWMRGIHQPIALTNSQAYRLPIETEAAKSNVVQTGKSATIVPTVATTNEDQSFIKKINADPKYQWKMPINFWGRVVDENNAPVAGAAVHFTWNDVSEKGTSDTTTKSDGNGLFSLTDKQGKRLYVEIGKDGYYSGGNSRGAAFEYANPYDGLFTPNKNKPIVFHLRKKGEAEPMIHGHKLFGFKTDGTPYYIDFLTGKKFTEKPPEWDLVITFTRSEPNADRKYDWTVKIETSGGGLIETNSDFMFPAPEAGYDNIELGEKASDTNWRSDVTYNLFFKSRGKIYGQFQADVYPRYNTNAAIDLNYFVNPSGSRNLEFDPQKQIR